jgi:hypothetical protein
MCKELPVIPVNKVVDPKRIIGKKWRAKEEEWHKGLLTQKGDIFFQLISALLCEVKRGFVDPCKIVPLK